MSLSYSITPNTDNLYSLGSSSLGWADLFLGSGGFVNFDGGTSNRIGAGGGFINYDATIEHDFDVSGAFKLDIRSTGLVSVDIDPFSNNTYDLGSSSLRWREIFSNNNLNVSLTKFKKNIKESDDKDCLNVCRVLRTIEFEWTEKYENKNDKRRYVGFDVDKLQKLLPNAVKGQICFIQMLLLEYH